WRRCTRSSIARRSRARGRRSAAPGPAWRVSWMTEKVERPAWEGVVEFPVRERLRKPRESGWTMVIDKGLGLHAIDDLMQVAAPVIDVVKLTFGTSAFFGYDLLKEKARTIAAHGVYCMPGGTLQEVAVWQGALDRHLDRARELGFTAIEISDG